MFEAAELRTIIDAARQPLKAMILLGINCGFGNTDCGRLPKAAVDLETGWIDYPRPKTAVPRRCPLWPETINAIEAWQKVQPAARSRKYGDLLFVTRQGGPWFKDDTSNPLSREFAKLLNRLKLRRKGLGFYALRHTFETIGGDSRDQVAVDFIMGHADESMGERYREGIEDDRLRDVVEHVREWLFAKPPLK
jgi:integrase